MSARAAAGRCLTATALAAGAAGAQPARPDTARRDVSRDTARLAPVTVTVTRTPTARDRAPWAVDALDARAVRGARLTNGVADALANVPGVYAADRGNYSVDQRVSIRGFGARANFGLRGVKVLLDGVPQTLPDGQSQLTNVDLADVGRVEVLRGAAASLYGNASGGVLAFTTDLTAPAAGVGLGGRFEDGAYDRRKLQLRGATRVGDGTVAALSVSRLTDGSFRQHADAEQRRLALAADHAFSPATTGTVRLYLADDPRAENPGALTPAEYAARADSAAAVNILRGANKRVSQQQLALGLRHVGDDGARADVTAYGVLRDLWNPLATPPPGAPSGAAGARVGTLTTIYRHAGGARASAAKRLPLAADPARAPLLAAGLEWQQMRDLRRNARATGGAQTTPADTLLLDQLELVSNVAPFAQLTWAPTARLLVDAGARYDRVRFAVRDYFLRDGVDNSGARTMAAASGHVGVSAAVATAFTPYANVSTDFETPTTTELQAQPNNAGGFSPDLGPQRSRGAEVGARGTAPGGFLRYSAAVFGLHTRDAIVQWQEVNGRAYFRNAGRTRTTGAEFGLGARAPLHDVADALGLDVAYTLTRVRFVDYRVQTGSATATLDGRTLPGVPERFARVGLRARPFAGTLAPLAFEADHTWASALYGDDRNTIRVAGYGRGVLDARTLWDGGRLRPFVAVQNAFDQHYVGSVTVNGVGGRVLEPAPGRTAYVGLALDPGR
ncbi:TonB-dependent receptor [Gemmatimonadetes bacterium T265]|nr:TonB-dependent receptor [Gemmatimonadetes bacterium T265]